MSLTLFTVLGVEVAKIIDGEFAAGEHSIRHNLDSIDSGVYYYSMKVDSFSASQKLIVE